MSNSARAQEKRSKRSKLSKSQRDKISRQHFGDKFVYQGHRLERGQDKQELMKQKQLAGN